MRPNDAVAVAGRRLIELFERLIGRPPQSLPQFLHKHKEKFARLTEIGA
jgi:hypothetical protein